MLAGRIPNSARCWAEGPTAHRRSPSASVPRCVDCTAQAYRGHRERLFVEVRAGFAWFAGSLVRSWRCGHDLDRSERQFRYRDPVDRWSSAHVGQRVLGR